MDRHDLNQLTPAELLRHAAHKAAMVFLERARDTVPPETYGPEDYRRRLGEEATELLMECTAPGPVLKFLYRAVLQALPAVETE